MARNFLNGVDLNLTQLLNAIIQQLATDPSLTKGRIWYNTATDTLRFTDGTNVRVLGRLDQISAPGADVSLNNQKITNLADPTAAQDAATRAFVLAQLEALTSGMSWKDSVRVASTANLNLASPGTAIDGITLANGNRVLVKDQTTASQNGIYVFNGSASAMTRATDADTAADLQGATVLVEEGTANFDTAWNMTTDAVTLGTTSLVWVKVFGGSAGTLRKFSADVGNGSATSIAVAHNLGTLDVQTQVRANTGGAVVEPDIAVTDANTVTLAFSVAPTANQYRCVVIG